jgi:EcsC protein family
VIEKSLRRAYGSFAVNPERYLQELRTAHGLPLTSFRDAFQIHPAALDHVAERTIKGTRRLAIVEGASFGLGGFLTLLPDVSVLGVLTFRLIQKLGLIYGFEYATEEERAELWLAAASAAGVEAGRDWVKKQVIERVATRIAEKAGTELAEKLSAGIVPIVSAGLGGILNAYFINGWGRRAHSHFREKHLEWRDRRELTGSAHLLLTE